MKRSWLVVVLALALAAPAQKAVPASIFGFRNSDKEVELERQFLAVPDRSLAEQHLKRLTAAPHIAGSPEDRQTAEYLAQKFREAGLDTRIVEYRVWMNYPAEIKVDVLPPATPEIHGPTREHVDADDPFQDDPRVLPGFSGYSPSGDVDAEVVYANYGRPEDIQRLKQLGVDLKGKILLVRYGSNYRGVKSLVAEQNGALGTIIYSDPLDDGWFKGEKYPDGPWRPDSAVQRGSVGYMFKFPGDPTTPGIASRPDLPDARRIPPEKSAEMPKIPTTPLSSRDAWPILRSLAGPASPQDWQGALPFAYHLGPGPVRVRLHLKQDYAFRTIWDVIGRVPGSESPDWVIAGNHRDAWVYGAVDPGSGTAALLEMVHGIGELLKAGWRPKRTMVFASWDAEEQGLIGSTEWAEDNAQQLANAIAYFNTDVAVSGANFSASAVPSLKQFIRDLTKDVPSPKGGTLYEAWVKSARQTHSEDRSGPPQEANRPLPLAQTKPDVPVGDLGSGSDYVAFLHHLGVPSADFSSLGPYGVYHSVFDNFAWLKKFGDPTFAYEQQQARVFGLMMMRMANADILPFDYEEYGREIRAYLHKTRNKARQRFAAKTPSFAPSFSAAERLIAAGSAIKHAQLDPRSSAASLNRVLRQAERCFLIPEGLPNRPWYKHAIYAPGEYTGYAAIVFPGVNEAIDQNDLPGTEQQLKVLTAAIKRAAQKLESYRR